MKSDLISIIIPVRNGEKTLVSCVKSALMQDHTNIEVLIVENGSDDSTPLLCRKLEEEDKRVRSFRIDKTGVSAARNAGLKAAKGEYISFLDADDRISPGMCSKLYDCIRSEGVDVAECGYLSFTESESIGTESKATAGSDARLAGSSEFITEELLKGDTRVWGKLFSRKAVENVAFSEELTIGEDMMFLLDVFRNGSRAALLDDKLYYYYQNPEGAMQRTYTPAFFDQILCWDRAETILENEFRDLYSQPDIWARLKTIQCVSALIVAVKIARSGKRRNADCREQFIDAARRVHELSRMKPVRDRLSRGQRARIFLLEHSELLFRLSCFYGRLS